MRKDKPSKTARKVALNIVTLSVKPGMDNVLPPGIVEATAQMLVASGAVGANTIRLARSRGIVSVYEAFDWMMPGQFEAFGHRKAFFERQVRKWIGADATQVLILGAGYDTLAWQLAPEFAGVNFFEIDRPATSCLKVKGIGQMGRRDNLHLIPEDLGKRKLVDVMEANDAWDPTAQTVIVAEGLLMYLPPEAVRDLFCQCAAITGTGSWMAFTYINRGGDGRPDVGRWTRLVLWILEVSGEPCLWSIRPEELGPFLDKNGWINAPDLVKAPGQHGVELFGVATR